MKLALSTLLLFLATPLPAHAAPGLPFTWPDGRKAAVSLAYDDGLDSQLDHPIPALDRHGFKASFYLPLSRDEVWRRIDEWWRAARDGHELGNHTLFHQCSGSLPDRDWVEPQRDLDTTSAEQMRDQVLLANTLLHALDGRSRRTFTVPCGDAMAAGQDYVAPVAPAFAAIKLGDGALVDDMQALDLAAVPFEAPVGVDGRYLIDRVEQGARRGTLVSLTFHGIGADYLAVSTDAHGALLDHLAAHRDIYWVATFDEIARYIRQQRAEADTDAAQAAGPLP